MARVEHVSRSADGRAAARYVRADRWGGGAGTSCGPAGDIGRARLGRWREARTADGEVSKQLKGAVKLLAELLGKIHDDLSVLLFYAETAVDDAWHASALVDVIGVRVVDGVRALPRKVRHEESRMEHVAHGVLQEAIIGESMAALVGE